MKRRIPVVEDNQPNRELLCDWLESEGFEVVYAANLARAKLCGFRNQHARRRLARCATWPQGWSIFG
jgi:CheY-like chemotaxis protein